MKNIKMITGFILLVKSVFCMVLAICFWKKKNSMAKLLVGVSAVSCVAGIALAVKGYKEESENRSIDCFDDCCECDGEYFDGDDFSDDDVLCSFEETDLYEENDNNDAQI